MKYKFCEGGEEYFEFCEGEQGHLGYSYFRIFVPRTTCSTDIHDTGRALVLVKNKMVLKICVPLARIDLLPVAFFFFLF